MDYNPYTAPQAPGFPPDPGMGSPGGTPQGWEVGEVLGIGWNAFKEHWPVLVFAPFLAGMIGSVPNFVPMIAVLTHAVALHSREYWILYLGALAVGLTVQSFFWAGLARIFLAAARGQSPSFGDLFGGGPRFLPVLAVMLLNILAVYGGMLALIVPGVIVALGLCLSQFFVVDANMGPIEAMKASWSATSGYKGQIFVYGLASFAVMVVGLCACCVGMYVAMPIVMVGMATIYVRLSGRGAPAAY